MLILYGQQINMFGQVETSQTGGQQHSEVNNLWLHTLCISISIFAMQSHTTGHLPYQRPPTIPKATYYTKGHLLYQRPPTIPKATLLYQRPRQNGLNCSSFLIDIFVTRSCFQLQCDQMARLLAQNLAILQQQNSPIANF